MPRHVSKEGGKECACQAVREHDTTEFLRLDYLIFDAAYCLRFWLLWFVKPDWDYQELLAVCSFVLILCIFILPRTMWSTGEGWLAHGCGHTSSSFIISLLLFLLIHLTQVELLGSCNQCTNAAYPWKPVMSYELVLHIPHNPITKIPTGSQVGGYILHVHTHKLDNLFACDKECPIHLSTFWQ
jgi:hypothetical protein